MNNLLQNCNVEYIIYITLAIIIIVVLYIFLKDSSLLSSRKKHNIIVNVDIKSPDNNNEDIDQPNTKILKYFGGSFCPHSRIGSKAYNLVAEIEDMYDDVTVEYYWSDRDEKDKKEFKLANIKYVPTLTNNNYEVIDLKIPNHVDTNNNTEDELTKILIKTIYYKL